MAFLMAKRSEILEEQKEEAKDRGPSYSSAFFSGITNMFKKSKKPKDIKPSTSTKYTKSSDLSHQANKAIKDLQNQQTSCRMPMKGKRRSRLVRVAPAPSKESTSPSSSPSPSHPITTTKQLVPKALQGACAIPTRWFDCISEESERKTLLARLSETEITRQDASFELLTSERTYVQDLTKIKEVCIYLGFPCVFVCLTLSF